MDKQEKITPLLQQYYAIRAQYPESLLFFQVGDFYELFFDDAKKAAAFLGIALTKRGTHKGEPIPLCGVPVHSLEHYLHKLVRGGFCVAICDQLEEAKPGTVVKRGVTQVLTPGTLTDSKLLDEKSASYILSFFEYKDQWALLFTELLTAQLYATVIPAGSEKALEVELTRFFPDEILVTQDKNSSPASTYFKKQGYFTSIVQPQEGSTQWIASQFAHTATAKKIEEKESIGSALALLYSYLKRTNEASLACFANIYFYETDDYLLLDPATQRNLELLQNSSDGGRPHTLLQTMDRCITSMGSRTLKKWLVRPLVSKKNIDLRADVVDYFKQNQQLRKSLQKLLASVGDGERVVGRIALSRGHLNDYVHLLRMLEILPDLKKMLETNAPALVLMLAHSIEDFSSLQKFLETSLNDDPVYDWKIKKGFNQRLDYLRAMVHDSHAAVLELEVKEQKLTGINSLKIRYNGVHGYYIEITNANAALVPDRYKRRQTLVNRERYTSEELQQLEHDVMNARSEIEGVEQELFEHIKQEVALSAQRIRKAMHAIAQSDVLIAFAQCAYERGYVRPSMTESRDIIIKEGKHPVIEQSLGSAFVPNDTVLTDDGSLFIITGPNMGGKSTYLRQVAQLCVLAQCGSFIPAQSAQLPLLDRIFTRIGASDKLAEGKSTFLVEMEETAHICQFATANSLVILDEVGRGTSTFDGLAIAQAVVEYIFSTVKARCLFATHYHELTNLEEKFPGIVSYYATSTQTKSGIVFLHKIVRGVADGSFGLEVARLAHLPEAVITRAYELEKEFLHTTTTSNTIGKPVVHNDSAELQKLTAQLRIAQSQLAVLTTLDYDDLSPKKAFDVLWHLKELHTKESI